MEERAEQLKGISNLAALVAGFVMISYLQFGFDVSGQNPNVLVGFGLTTSVVVRHACAPVCLPRPPPSDPPRMLTCHLPCEPCKQSLALPSCRLGSNEAATGLRAETCGPEHMQALSPLLPIMRRRWR